MLKKCSEALCQRTTVARGLCRYHYNRWRTANIDPCTIDGCDRPQNARGWCQAHYLRWREHGDPLGTAGGFTLDGGLEERFWSRVDQSGDECWEWQKSKSKHGYGYFYYQGKLYKAHRLSYQLEHGEIPEGLSVLHRCDNPPCVRPSHLYAGTQTDNMRDRALRRKGFSPRLETT